MKMFPFMFLLLLSACSEKRDKSLVREEPRFCLTDDFKSSLQFLQVKEEEIDEHIHLMGTVTTNPEKMLNYVSLVKGVVSAVYFSLGDEVKKGQLLAELLSPELSHLQSQIASINAQLPTAARHLNALQSMHDDKLASDKDLEEARAHLKMLQSEKKKANADLALYGGNNAKGVFQVFAPSSGTVITKNINQGMQISDESGSLFTIASLNNVWVMANVYIGNLELVSAGMDVDIQALAYPNEIFRGKITAITPVVDENEKVLKARIELDNPGNKLKPGMVADVNASKKTNAKAVAVPVSAVVFDNNEHYVIVYNSDCSLSVRKINLYAKNNHIIYCTGGLDVGEIIVTNHSLLLYEQLKNFENN